jgi:hypothetical protein
MKFLVPLLAVIACASAHAEVTSSSAGGFEIKVERKLAATPIASYRALGEIGRVIHAAPGRLLRLDAPLGPLQALAVNAILSFEFAAADTGTKLTVTFRASGDGTTGQLAAPVDGVITEQIDRYTRFLATGKPGK